MQTDFILYLFIYLFILILSLLIIFFVLFIKKLNYYLVHNKCNCNCNSNNTKDLIVANLFDNDNKIQNQQKIITTQSIQPVIQSTESIYQSTQPNNQIIANQNAIKNSIMNLYQQLENNNNITVDNYPFSIKIN
jgi:hypothetical protein